MATEPGGSVVKAFLICAFPPLTFLDKPFYKWPAAGPILVQNQGGASMSFLEWLVVGLIAGWLAGKVMKGGGYGLFADLILGILGGILGGWIFGMLGIWPGGGIIGSLLVAFIGAVILVWLTRLIKKKV